jgi:hypothetical protein
MDETYFERGRRRVDEAGRPLGKLGSGDQNGFDPMAAFHNCRGDAICLGFSPADFINAQDGAPSF